MAAPGECGGCRFRRARLGLGRRISIATLTDTLANCEHLIVDLSSATFIDSSTIMTLVSAKRHADRAERKFNLVLASTPIVERVLEITRVLPVLNRVKTVEEALRD